VRTPRYQAIADELRTRISSGDYTAGRLLPSESNLSKEFSVSRVTVRRALEQLREAGILDARQGLGWYVASEPLRQPLDHLDTIEEQLAAAGAVAERRVLDFAFAPASAKVAEILGEKRVLEVRRVNLADGEPFARVTVWCPEGIGASLSRDDVEAFPFYELLDVEFAGAVQSMGGGGPVAGGGRGRPRRRRVAGGTRGVAGSRV
jgi:GntR family transcriptional regulator